MNILKLTTVLIILFIGVTNYAQKTCKVLDVDDKGVYLGSCKNGLANGKGKFTFGNGKVVYYGEFLEGKMHGEGEMFSLMSGQKILIKEGVWKENIFIEDNTSSKPYNVFLDTHLERYNIVKLREGNEIRVNIFQNGQRLQNVSNLFVNTTSGRESPIDALVAYDDLVFPFNFDIIYNVPSKMGTGSTKVVFKIQINEPGVWLIALYN